MAFLYMNFTPNNLSIAKLINSVAAVYLAGAETGTFRWLVNPDTHSTLPLKRIPGLSFSNLDQLYTKLDLGRRVLEAKTKHTGTRCCHVDILIVHI